MPKKTGSEKSKKPKNKKQKANDEKLSVGSQSPLRTIKVHPHFANAITSLKKLAPEELTEIKNLASTEFAESGQSTGCWLSDSGGQQHCVNLPPDVCTRKGGISVPTKCPSS
jgi:hypothetical protein